MALHAVITCGLNETRDEQPSVRAVLTHIVNKVIRFASVGIYYIHFSLGGKRFQNIGVRKLGFFRTLVKIFYAVGRLCVHQRGAFTRKNDFSASVDKFGKCGDGSRP